MPLYEYRCAHCHHHFEVFHPVGGSAGPCPVCGGPARRVFSSVGLIFKGSGFHATDYRKTPSSDGESPPASRTESSAKTSS
jgi:putative FmdB family regulatory protein